MTVFVRVVGNYDTGDVDLLRLEELGQARGGVNVIVRHTIVANERVGEDQDLASVRRVGKALGIAGHGGVEHDLASARMLATERDTLKCRAVSPMASSTCPEL